MPHDIDIGDVFGPNGLLATRLEGYEERAEQRRMAERVHDVFDQRGHLIVEAATGTGKTLAYLVPAVLSGVRTIVSTATKTLQEQILTKDLPLLHDVLPVPFSSRLLKGRRNYLCLWQWEAFDANPRFRRGQDKRFLPLLREWVARTETGDRAELPELPDDFASWAELSIGGDGCLGRKCAHYDDCFVFKARAEAAEADIVVVNHHLYFADLALRVTEKAELLPAYEAAIFDEAHHLESVAGSFFGVSVSNYRFADLESDVINHLGREGRLTEEVQGQVALVRERRDALFGQLGHWLRDGGRTSFAKVVFGDRAEELEELHRRLDETLGGLRDRVGGVSAGEVADRLTDRMETLSQELSHLLAADDERFVYTIESRGRGVFLTSHPIDLRDVLRDTLYDICGRQLFTSATMTTGRTFDFFRDRMGMPASADELMLDPVFDYRTQAILYAPSTLPAPNAADFIDRAADEMEALVKLTQGRAFLLFTSYRNLNRAYDLLRPRLPYRLFKQGEMERNALLEAFREDTHSVLFATSSFWEGVDVQGEALSLVVIDKLPFASPGDPVVAARIEHIEKSGGSGFRDFQLPAAVISLKQGVGRLIRHRGDIGIVAVLDQRIVTKGYGRTFLASLPPMERTDDLGVVEAWWRLASEESKEPAPEPRVER